MRSDLNLTRAVLTAAGAVALLPALIIVAGGFIPWFPGVGRFGALISAGLPWIGLDAVASVALGLVALRFGGGFLNRAVAGLAIATLAGVMLIVGQILVVAAGQGAKIDLFRMAGIGGSGTAEDLHPDQVVTFATIEGEPLAAEVWQPSEPQPTGATGDRAGVMFVHGGGFTGGGLRSRPAFFRLLADRGIPVVDIEYRLAPPPRWNEATADVLCALGWVASHGSELDIDPTRIFLIGDSAGGNLVLMAAFDNGRANLVSSCGGQPPTPAGVVAIAPAADLKAIWENDSIIAGGLRFPEAYIGGTPGEYPDRYRAASPTALIEPGLPPTLIIQGSIDHLVAPELARTMASQLRHASVDCGLLVIPFADHGFEGAEDGYGSQIVETTVPAFIAAHTGAAQWSGPACPLEP